MAMYALNEVKGMGLKMNNLIGNTPLIKIKYEYNNKIKEIYTKLEYYNLTGSIKDRMADFIIKEAYKNKLLVEGQAIIEATSGNTGISLASIGTLYHNPVYIFMPDWVSSERKKIMEMYGAIVTLISKEEGGFKRCIEEADLLADKVNGFRVNQFSNPNNLLAHFQTTGVEIINKLKGVDGFVSGIGTGGTLIGTTDKLKEVNSNLVVCAVEPKELPILKDENSIGSHKIDGIGDDFIPELVDRDKIDIIYDISDEDAINMSRLLSSKLGLGVGISSGCNFLGSVLLNEEIDGNIVTVFPDDNKKYLSTDLSKKINKEGKLISNKIKLISYEIV